MARSSRRSGPAPVSRPTEAPAPPAKRGAAEGPSPLEPELDPEWVLDRDGRLTGANESFLALISRLSTTELRLGDRPLELLARRWPKRARRWRQRFEQALSGTPGEFDDAYFTGGELRAVRVTLVPEVREGRVIAVRGRIERARAENRERRSSDVQEMFAKIFKLSPAPITVSVLATGEILDVNQAFTVVTGFAREEVLGRTMLELGIWLHPEQREEVVARLQRDGAISGFELAVRNKSGEPAWVLASFVRTRLFDEDCIVTIAEDITDRRRMENSLRESEERFSRLFHASPAPILITAVDDGTILEANEAFAEMVGYGLEELIGRTTVALGIWVDPRQRQPILEEVRRTGRAVDLEVKIRHRSGQVRTAYGGFVRSHLFGRAVLISVSEDITERKLWEERRGQASKLEMIGQLAGGVAHDFNNRLMAILGAADLLRTGRASPEAQRRALDRIGDSARKASVLTGQLLAFGRQQPLRPTRIDPDERLHHFSEVLHRTLGEQVQVELELSHGSDRIWIDPSQFEQVLLDLALNARDAMPRGGRLILRSRLADGVAAPLPAGIRPGRYVRVEVEDTGEGMPPEVLDHLFEPFFTTKPLGAGTGLGLSTVYGIVHQSGGVVLVDSAPGKGTRFSLYFPSLPASPAELEQAVPTVH